MENKSLNALLKDSILRNWDNMALSDLGGINYQYKDVALLMAKLHIIFDAAGLRPGDKVAILAEGSNAWIIRLGGHISFMPHRRSNCRAYSA